MYCLEKNSDGFYCVLRKHTAPSPHCTIDNKRLDKHGKPGLTLWWENGKGEYETKAVKGVVPEVVTQAKAVDPTLTQGEIAKARGYSGNACGECQSLRTRNNGSCLVCDDCGRTTGCS